MNIALFGGAFDPPHIGHKTVADSLIHEDIVDEVWFVPVFKHPWADRYNKHNITSYEQRVEMLEITINSQEDRVNKYSKKIQKELAKKQKVAHFKSVSFTYDTLKFFQDKFPQHTFSWVMGSEYLTRFDDFLKGHPLLKDFQFYIYPRAGYELDKKLKKENMVFLPKMHEITASSTEAKHLISQKKPTDTILISKVAEYISKTQLFVIS